MICSIRLHMQIRNRPIRNSSIVLRMEDLLIVN